MSYLGLEEFVSPADALKKGHLIALTLFKLKVLFYSLLPTSHPSEDARMARRQQNRAA